MKLRIDTRGGNAPYQMEGTFDGYYFYFRARHEAVSIEIWRRKRGDMESGDYYDEATRPLSTELGVSQFWASWINDEQADAFLDLFIKRYRRERG